MKIRSIITTSVLATLVLSTTASAGWNDMWSRAHLDFARSRCWPSPFVEQDRASVYNYFDQMTAVGIRQQNTLSDHYFDPQDQSVNYAGKRKIAEILTNREERRTIFVLQTLTQEQTQARVAAVQQALVEMVGNPNATEIFVSPTELIGRPADYIDDVYRRERSTIPAPRLPASAEAQ